MYKIENIQWLNDAGELKTPKELLDNLGLEPEPQQQLLKLTSPPERGGVLIFCLQQLHSDCVLVWAKRYIARRWSFVEKLDEIIFSHEDGRLQLIIHELSERPIDSMQAFSNFYLPLPIQRLAFDGF